MSDNNGENGDGNVTPLDPKRRRRPVPPNATPVDVRAQRAAMMLGPECPYVPLGYDQEVYYVIDRNRLVRGMRPRDMARNMLVAVCGERWLEQRYPRKRKGEAVF